MRISDLQVDGFGVWKGLSVDRLSPDITVFYGQNEAGKTTLMQFVRSMLFGFAPDRLEKYTPPVYGGVAGGSLFVKAPQGTYEIQRHVDPSRPVDAVGDLSLIDTTDGDLHGNAQLSQMLSQIDESIFNNVFSVGLREIQELGALNNTQAAEHLYRLTSGLDRVSLVDVMRDLKSRREAIWSDSEGHESRLVKLNHRRNSLKKEIDELRSRTKRWARVATQAKDANRRLDEIQVETKRLERESKLVDVSMQISERWSSRNLLTQQIEGFGKLPDPRDVEVRRLDEINERIAKQKEKIEQTSGQRVKLHRDAAALPLNRLVWRSRNRIEALAAHTPWLESLQRQAQQLRGEIDKIEGDLNGEVSGLGTQLKLKNRDIHELGSRRFQAVRSVARQLAEQNRLLSRLKDEADKAKFELVQQEQVLGETISEQTGSIPETLDETSRQVNRLRRRIELEEKIQKLTNNQKELEREVDNVVAEQVLPVNKLTVIGIVFITGIIMAGFGLVSSLWHDKFWPTSDLLGRASGISSDLGFLLMILGTVFGFVSLGLKYHWERLAKEEMDDFRHQMDLVRQQIKRARSERDEIDRLLPQGIGQHELELQDSETKLQRLESLVPMENRARAARMRLDDLRRQITAQEREVETWEKKWQSSLRGLGLPDTLTPSQVKELSQRTGKLSGHNSRLETLKSELVERERELQLLGGRVSELLHDSAPDVTEKDALKALNLLSARLSEQRQLVAQRKELLANYRQLRTALHKSKRELDKLLTLRQKILTGAGVETESEYRELSVKYAQREKLIDKRHQVSEQIAAALGNQVKESDVAPMLNSYGQAGLEKHWESLQAEIEQLKKESAKLLQLRGEYLQEIKTLSEDTRLDQAQLELNCVEADIEECQRQWQVLATGTQMLEAIRESYEAKRQPETLKEASGYLKELTEGHYVRIWTRLIGEQLLVDNENGETLSVDKLSRGTREAVYLSLRLALVNAYARRGAVLPLVLDDVLVNFDAKRARGAAKLLVKFARNGYQIMMFTCHDHMRDLFHSLDADVRVLPHHRDVVERQAVPVRYSPKGKIEPTPLPAVAEPKVTPKVAEVVKHQPLVVNVDVDDTDWEYELSALRADQESDRHLAQQLAVATTASRRTA